MKFMEAKYVWISLAVLFSFSILAEVGIPVYAEDTATMLKQVKNEIRQAEKDMFAGKTDKAIAALKDIKTLLLKAKEADPNSTTVKTLENKYRKLTKDLERRTGKDLGGGTLTARESSTATSLPTKPAPKSLMPSESISPPTGKTEKPGSANKVPYAARKPLSNATRLLDSLERNLDNLSDPNYGGNKDQLVENAEAKLPEIRSNLDKAKALASEKGVTAHQSFDEVEARLKAAEKKVAEAKGDYEEAKSEAATRSKEVDADVEALKSEYDRVSSVFERATGTVMYYNDLKPVEELIATIENFEQNKLANLQKEMDTFAAKYGSTREEIDKKADTMGYSGQYRASFPYTALAEGIENVKKTRIVMAEDLAKKANERLGNIENVHDFCIAEQFGEVKTWLTMADRYDPENPSVKEALAGIDQQIAHGMKDLQARIDKRTWPGHASNAPKDAGKLARIALDWFKASPDWGKRDKEPRRPLAVAVTGPWSIQKKNILGEPIMYGLPILLAVQVDSDKELGVARVYSLTLRTAEMRGVKMEPPFDHITVGNSYFIRPATVK